MINTINSNFRSNVSWLHPAGLSNPTYTQRPVFILSIVSAPAAGIDLSLYYCSGGGGFPARFVGASCPRRSSNRIRLLSDDRHLGKANKKKVSFS